MAEEIAWERESAHAIRWAPPVDPECGGPAPVCQQARVEASYDSGYTWEEVGLGYAWRGRLVWTVPAESGPLVRFRTTFVSHATGAPLSTPVPTADVRLSPSRKREYVWTRVANNAPWGPRDGAGAIVHGGKLWLLGGWNPYRFPRETANDVWSSVDGATWTQVRPNTFLDETFDRTTHWEGRHAAGYHSFGGKMWIVGGDPNQGHYQTDTWSSTDGVSWTRTDIHTTTRRTTLDTNPESPTYGTPIPYDGWEPREEAQYGMRAMAMSGVFQGKLWLMGGQRVESVVDPVWPGAPGKVFNDVWSSGDGASWTQTVTSGPMWAPRGLAGAAVSFKDRLWIVGGGTYDDVPDGTPIPVTWRTYRNDVWSTADGARWSLVDESAPFSARIYHNVGVFDGVLWVIGGAAPDNVADAWYTEDGTNWYDGSEAAFVSRHAASLWVRDDAMFVGAGNAFDNTDSYTAPEDGNWLADVWKIVRKH
ncbi:MAG TPA: hypothetical protein PLR99_06610 [Polyangiaceae bacterium]|nr:hypothetical protein [Polyangiaceae bacterium]